MLYAAYGSNLHPLRIQQRSPSARLVGTGAISNMSLRFHKCGFSDFSGKCNIIPYPNHTTYVAVYDVSPADMLALDRYEGAGAGYDRTLIHVAEFGECVTYVASASHVNEILLPFSWYKALVIAGCERLGLPKEYIEAVRAVRAVQDEDCDRHTTHMQLVETCKKWHK